MAEAPETVVRTEAPAASSEARPDHYVGTVVDGRYVIESVLGEGGMGIVLRARHRVIDKRVAVKVLRSDMARDREMTERFVQEAKAASSIGNPHIVDIADFGEMPDGSAYFVMEYLDGQNLGQLMSATAGPLPVPRLVHVARQIAEGLHAAHAAGIVHRDLKPDNVFLIARGSDKDFVKILDFGIAKVGGESSKITRAGSVFGTPHYMSPEQAAGTPVDARTDVYALGVILYEMAAGKVPFDADNFMGILTQHMYKAPVPLRALSPAPDVPPGLDAIVLKCLSKRPEARYASMAELVTDLELLEKGLVPAAVGDLMARSGGFNVPADYFKQPTAVTPAAGVPARPARSPIPFVLGALVALGVVGAAIVGVMHKKAKEKEATAQASTASTEPIAPAATATSSAAPASTAAASAASASAPSSDAPRVTYVFVEPSDAKVTRDGKELTGTPIKLSLATGEVAQLAITRAGYAPKSIEVKAGDDAITAKLTPASRGGGDKSDRGASGAASAKPRSGNGIGDGFNDPWSK